MSDATQGRPKEAPSAEAALLPCPFCGSHADELGLLKDETDASWHIRCYGCHLETAYQDTRADATAAWNCRAPGALAAPAGGAGDALKPEDFAEAVAEVRMWSGSAFLAGEKVGKTEDQRCKSELYSFLCRLGNNLHYWEELARLRGAAAGVEAQSVRQALLRLENACEEVAKGRSQAAYDAMVAGGQSDALIALDDARRNARVALLLGATGVTVAAAPTPDGEAEG